jgi:hypothetical protein
VSVGSAMVSVREMSAAACQAFNEESSYLQDIRGARERSRMKEWIGKRERQTDVRAGVESLSRASAFLHACGSARQAPGFCRNHCSKLTRLRRHYHLLMILLFLTAYTTVQAEFGGHSASYQPSWRMHVGLLGQLDRAAGLTSCV